MAWFDYERIEEELDLVVPEVFRLFMDTAEAHSFPLAEIELYDNTQSLIDGNWHARLNWDQWQNHYLLIGSGDGCGNYDFILARYEDDDDFRMWYHDPVGIRSQGTATEFFRQWWDLFTTKST